MSNIKEAVQMTLAPPKRRHPLSVRAYNSIKESGLLNKSRMQVYDWLYRRGPATGREIAYGLFKENVNNANVRARLTELRDMGCVGGMCEVTCPVTGKRVTLWDITNNLPDKDGLIKPPKKVDANRAAENLKQFMSEINVGYQFRYQIDEFAAKGFGCLDD